MKSTVSNFVLISTGTQFSGARSRALASTLWMTVLKEEMREEEKGNDAR